MKKQYYVKLIKPSLVNFWNILDTFSFKNKRIKPSNDYNTPHWREVDGNLKGSLLPKINTEAITVNIRKTYYGKCIGEL